MEHKIVLVEHEAVIVEHEVFLVEYRLLHDAETALVDCLLPHEWDAPAVVDFAVVERPEIEN